MSVLDFRVSSQNKELQMKRIYHVETTRFPVGKYPKADAQLNAKNGKLFVAVGSSTELHTATFHLIGKKAIDIKRYHYNDSIIDVSVCSSKDYFYFIVSLSNSTCFIMQPDGRINLIKQKGLTKALIYKNSTKNNQMYVALGTSSGGVILIYPILGEEPYATISKKAPVTSLRSSNDGSKIIAGFSNGNVSVLDGDSLEELWSRTFPFGSIIDAVTCPIDNYITFSAQDDNVYIYSTKDDQKLKIEGHTSFVISIDPEKKSKNNEFMLSSSGLDGRFGLWRAKISDQNISQEKLHLSNIISTPIRFERFYHNILLTINDKGSISVYIAH
ncbi:hypothetical protein TVAG_390530 [Trichomonas vaginalis G3]|uniref:Anaphase-promoting complex subunit 4 WD40 domain-containing protein n=1 Tax=Trichomonas vaginalis (strain ATCC PRA-98 / G3) TaxID=412133 RepID=A2ESV7_TRIV3|nr:nucleoporin domain family [Trichomonas vaginalis G3]EAY04283.1 hypothetical protein TVAG_390530 [Trichomonas vaginalis G3]KAI5549376.1 nucleoporin domain family [Trichomonas vaginalis G3]|eukprot:XP_001316506.1 hypothetical protein [Trichomonas vaginalis G3]